MYFMLQPIHEQFIVLFSPAYTLGHDLSVQMSTQYTQCGESNLNFEGEKKHFIEHVHSSTHTNKRQQIKNEIQ